MEEHLLNKLMLFINRLLIVYAMHIPQVFGISADPQPRLEGHVFPNPVDKESYMVMLVYKNASLTREGIFATSHYVWYKVSHFV